MTRITSIVIFSIIYCSFLLPSIYAQTYSYTQFTSDDGLPSNYLYRIVEDNEGFIWISSDNGVSKFDGYSFKNFTVDDGLPINETYSIVKDKAGYLWLGNVSGKVCYIFNDTVVCLEGLEGYSFAYTIEDDFVVYTNGGKYIFVYQGKVILESVESFSTQDLRYVDSLFYKARKITSPDGVIDEKWTLQEGFDEIRKIDKSIETFRISKSHLIYKGEQNLYIAHRDSKTFQSYPLDFFDDNLSKIVIQQLEDDILRLHTLNGVYDIDKNLLSSKKHYDLYSKYSVRYCLEDSFGNIWFSTAEAGLFLIRKNNLKTRQFYTDKIVNDKFEKLIEFSSVIYAFNDKGGIYLLNQDGLIEVFKGQKISNIYGVKRYKGKLLIISDYIMSSFDPIQNQTNALISEADFESFTIDGCANYLYRILAMNNKAIDIADNYLICSARNFTYSINLEQKIISCFLDGRSQKIYKSPYSELVYLASGQSLFSYNPHTSVLDTVLFCSNDKRTTDCFSFCTDMLEIDSSKLLIATVHNGVHLYNSDLDSLSKVSSIKNVNRILYDNDIIYLAGAEGITLLDSSYQEIYSYSKLDGLSTTDVNDILIKNDTIYAATNLGVSVINKSTDLLELADKSENTEIVSIHSDSTFHSTFDSLSFAHNDNNIKISYSFLDYESTGNIRYAYKLLPIERDWNYTSERLVSYSDLKQGEYAFMLKAIDQFSNEHALKKPLSFKVRKAYWQTGWFILLSVALSLGVLFALVLWYVHSAKRRLENEYENNQLIAELKLESLRSQMNPHFIFNSLGSIQYYIREHKVEEADEYLALFAQLMRRYLDSSVDSLISLEKELLLLSEYIELEEMRFEDKFLSIIELDESVDATAEWIPSMLIQPFVENAINHGLLRRKSGGILRIHFYKESEDELICEVSDNGLGVANTELNESKSHKSRAMKNVKDRLQVITNSGIAKLDVSISDLCSDSEYPGTKVSLRIKDLNKYEEV